MPRKTVRSWNVDDDGKPLPESPPKADWAHVDERTQYRGWFQRPLWLIEASLWGRWPYWMAICLNGTIGDDPIPQIPFTDRVDDPAPMGVLRSRVGEAPVEFWEHVGTPREAWRCLQRIVECGRYQGATLLAVLDWFNWAFGSNRVPDRPKLPESMAVDLYSQFNMGWLVAHPLDWGQLLAREFNHGGAAWFPTPHSVAQAMVGMTFTPGEDHRTKSVHDPCVGTGVFLRLASNHSLRLSGLDIDPVMVSACELSGWLHVPWLVWGRGRLIREFKEAMEGANHGSD